MTDLAQGVLAPKTTLAKLRAAYEEKDKGGLMNALVVGPKGIGKTSLIGTAPKPILLFSFDPGGYHTIRHLIPKGELIVVDLGTDSDISNPRAYLEFDRTYNDLGREGAYENFATVALDSLTTFTDALLWQIMKKEGRTPASMSSATNDSKQGMRIQDWGTALNAQILLTRLFYTLPCHTIITGHLEKSRDEVVGTFINRIALPGQAQAKVPANIPEQYVLMRRREGDRYILTDTRDGFEASTRYPTLSVEEPPDLTKLMKKAGISHESKPSLDSITEQE